MIDVALRSGDLIVSTNGDISLLNTDDDNIIQMVNSAISTIKGENIFHLSYGNDAWNKRLKISDSGFRTVEVCAKEAILNNVAEVSEISSIEAIKGDVYGECVIKYALLTVTNKLISSSTSINIL